MPQLAYDLSLYALLWAIAMTETVNDQVVDSVTSTNLKVLGDAPSVAVGTVYASLSHCISLTMASATSTQQGMDKIGETITAVAVVKILGQM